MLPQGPNWSHMPFATTNGRGQFILFHCSSNSEGRGKSWKLHYTFGGVTKRITTGLAEEACECSPTAWEDGSGWHISLITGSYPERGPVRLIKLDYHSLDEQPREMTIYGRCAAGFVSADAICWAGRYGPIYYKRGSVERKIDTSARAVLRVSYVHEQPHLLLASTGDKHGSLTTSLIHTDSGDIREVRRPCGGHTYKPTIFRDCLISPTTTSDFEDRQLELCVGHTIDHQCGNLSMTDGWEKMPPLHGHHRPPLLEGPGTELKKMLEALGISPKQCAKCEGMIRRMNLWGHNCLKHKATIKAHLLEAYSQLSRREVLAATLKGTTTDFAWEVSLVDPIGGLIDLAVKRSTPAPPLGK